MNESLIMQLQPFKIGYIFFSLISRLNGTILSVRKRHWSIITLGVGFFLQSCVFELLRAGREELLRKTLSDFFFQRGVRRRAIRELLDNGYQIIPSFETRPGVWLEGNNQIVYDDNGRIIGHMSMIYDVSHIKKGAQIIADEESLKQICNFQYCVAADGSEGFLSLSFEFYGLFGIIPGKEPRTIMDLFSRVYYADAERVMSMFTASFKSRSNIETEFRINHPEKGVRWLKTIALPDQKDGDRTVWNGYFTDFSERKKKDEWIGFLNTALMNISDSVILTNTTEKSFTQTAGRRAARIQQGRTDRANA